MAYTETSQPELTDPSGIKNMMPRLPKVDAKCRTYLSQKSDMNAAWDRAEEELKKTAVLILGVLKTEGLASYRHADVEGREHLFERKELEAQLRVRKAGKPGGGRTRRAKA